LRIALIDTTVNEKLVCCSESIRICDYNEHHVIYGTGINHGTVCAAIIQKYAPDADIINLITVNNCNNACHVSEVILALSYCLQNDIKLISMSLGTRDLVDIAQLYTIIKLLVSLDFIIVAPGSRNRLVYPAAFDGVVYVEINDGVKYMDNRYFIEKCPNGLLAYIASGKQIISFKDGSETCTPNYSSFAVPVITSHIYHILKNNPNMKICEMHNELDIKSQGYITTST
jgi:hypothetical protein